MSENDKLTTKQEHAIAQLLGNTNIRDTAHAVGVAEKTLYRWLKETEFQRVLQSATSASITAAIARLTGLIDTAIATLESVMSETLIANRNAGARVAAAKVVFEQISKWKELHELEARIANLEASK